MNNKKVGALNKKEMDKKKNMIIIIVVAVVLVILVIMLVTRSKSSSVARKKVDFPNIIEKAETKIIFVESSDASKCKNCESIKKHLDDKKINYLVYDVEDYSNKEYKETLKSIEINPGDFGYPAVIYMRDGKLYANVINITDTSAVDNFISTYELTEVK